MVFITYSTLRNALLATRHRTPYRHIQVNKLLPNKREVVRAFILGPASQLLLIKGQDPQAKQSKPWWFTVGGGIKQDESPTEALSREIYEETGQKITHFSATPFSRTCEFTFASRHYLQHEVYMVARTQLFEVKPKKLSNIEAATFIDFRWWTFNELELCQDTLHPEDLRFWYEYLIRH